MARRFFTADFHLGMGEIIKYEGRPFRTVDDMDRFFEKQCTALASDDIVVHVGDLYSFRNDRGSPGRRAKPAEFLAGVKATFVNVRGNHDVNNKVKSLCDSMRTSISRRFPNVSVSHYPTYDKRCEGHFQDSEIHLCGHVHSRWKHCLDLDHNCLNVNVGVDVWGYMLVSEDQLFRYLNSLFKNRPDSLYRCRVLDGKPRFEGSPNF